MIYTKHIATALSMSLFLASGFAFADGGSSSTAVRQQVQKNASQILKGSYGYLKSLQKYSFRATVIDSFESDGKNIVIKHTSDAKVMRPSQFKVDSIGENINRTVYLSNGIFTLMDNDEKYYASVKTGKGIDGTLDYISKKLGIVLPLSTLLHSDMNKFIHPKRVQYFGTKVISGTECNYIAFRQKNTTVHLWIENSSTPFIRAAKIVTDIKNNKGTTDMTIMWNTDSDFLESIFLFKAPKDASNVSMVPVN